MPRIGSDAQDMRAHHRQHHIGEDLVKIFNALVPLAEHDARYREPEHQCQHRKDAMRRARIVPEVHLSLSGQHSAHVLRDRRWPYISR